MIKYIVKDKNGNILGSVINELNNYSDGGIYRNYSPNDFVIEEERLSVYDLIKTEQDAQNYLNSINEINKTSFDKVYNRKISAFCKLLTIAEIWNKLDDFTIERAIPYYCPKFELYENDKYICRGYLEFEGFVNAGTPFCFRTHIIAEKFGDMFIDLFNDLLL